MLRYALSWVGVYVGLAVKNDQVADANKIDNLWLLEAEANMASGENIKSEKNAKIMAVLDAASKKPKKKGGDKDKPPAAAAGKDDDSADKSKPIFETPPDLTAVRQDYRITFEKVEGGLEPLLRVVARSPDRGRGLEEPPRCLRAVVETKQHADEEQQEFDPLGLRTLGGPTRKGLV